MTAHSVLPLIAALFLAIPALAGRILVNNDEWAFTDLGYTEAGAANADRLARNVAAFLTGGSGKILIYSSDHGLTESNYLSSLNAAGYAVTVDSSGTRPFDLITLAAYGAVFLGGDGFLKDDAVLAQYVNQGGGVYIVAGTAVGGSAAEAARWNPFLNAFGLHLGAPYNLFLSTTFRGSSAHPVFDGVGTVFYHNGNSVSLTGSSPYASIIESSNEGYGLFGVYDDATGTPEPQTVFLLGAGLFALEWLRRRKVTSQDGSAR
jgi:hypothetical protein